LSKISPKDYDGALFPGGRGPLYDLRHNKHSIALIEGLLNASKPVGAICHAGAVLLNVRDQRGLPIAKDRSVTAFTDSEEELVGLTKVVPYAVETEFRKQGARFTRASDWSAHVVVDGNLITGQNPASAQGVADAMLKLLK
jgi:putative intracellular protease/amidase